MVFNTKTWIDVPDESNPPPGAVAKEAAEFNRLEQGIADAHAHLAEKLLTHGGVIIYVEASTVPPANPPAGLLWHQTDGVKRDLRNIGTPAAPVWEDVTRDKLITSDLVTDYVVSGLLPAVPAPASRTASVPAGQAYVIGRRVAKAAQSLTFAKASDTYVDLDRDGNYVLAPVANSATAPAIAANSIRLFRAVTDADVAQVDTVTVATVTNSAIYTVRINGVDVSYTSDATATAGEIAIGLRDAINASTDPNVTPVTAATAAVATDTTATMTITADVAGAPFTATVSANLTIANTTANNTSKITAIADLRTTDPTVRGTDVSQQPAVGLYMVSSNTAQGIPHAAETKLVYQVEEADTDGWFDLASSRFVPQRAGWYVFTGHVLYSQSVDQNQIRLSLWKNGARVKSLGWLPTSGTGLIGLTGDTIAYANGTTDYFEMATYHEFGVTTNTHTDPHFNWFSARFIGT